MEAGTQTLRLWWSLKENQTVVQTCCTSPGLYTLQLELGRPYRNQGESALPMTAPEAELQDKKPLALQPKASEK